MSAWDTFDFNVAGHWLPALINGDQSGLSTEEVMALNRWRDRVTCGRGHWSQPADAESEGGWMTCDVSGLKAMCEPLQWVFLIDSVSPDKESAHA